MRSEKWNEVFKRLLENRIIADRVATLQNEGDESQIKSEIIELPESNFPDLYKFIQEKRNLALSILYNKTEIKDALIVYKLTEKKRGKPLQPFYFPVFDLSKEPPAGLLNALTSSQDKLLNQIEKQIAEFATSGLTELHLPPANSYIRRFEHQISAKFGLKSLSQGEGRDRHVVIQKGRGGS